MCEMSGDAAGERIMGFCKQSPELMANIVYELIASWKSSNRKGKELRRIKILETIERWLLASHPYYETRLEGGQREACLENFSMNLAAFYLDDENFMNRIDELHEPAPDIDEKIEKIMGPACLAYFKEYNKERDSDLKQHLCAYRMLDAVVKAVESPLYSEAFPKDSRMAQSEKWERNRQVLAGVYLLTHCREMAFPLKYLDFSKGLNVAGNYIHRSVEYMDFLHKRVDTFEFKTETIFDYVFRDISLVVRDKIIIHACGYCGLICCGTGRTYCGMKCVRHAKEREALADNRMEYFFEWIEDRLAAYDGALDRQSRAPDGDITDIDGHIKTIRKVMEINITYEKETDRVYILARIMANIDNHRWDELETFTDTKDVGCLKKYLEQEHEYYPMLYR